MATSSLNQDVSRPRDSKRKKIYVDGNASKRHRDRVNDEFKKLAALLPFPDTVTSKLDKSSILKLCVSYIQTKNFLNDMLPRDSYGKDVGQPASLNTKRISNPTPEPADLASTFSKAIDGFLLVATEDMRVMYVSDTVGDYLGCSPANIMHENLLSYVNPTDHATVYNAVRDPKLKDANARLPPWSIVQQPPLTQTCSFASSMKCSFSVGSRCYSAYKPFSFSGHLRRSQIKEGRHIRTMNVLVAYVTPLEPALHHTLNSSSTTEHPDGQSSFQKEAMFQRASSTHTALRSDARATLDRRVPFGLHDNRISHIPSLPGGQLFVPRNTPSRSSFMYPAGHFLSREDVTRPGPSHTVHYPHHQTRSRYQSRSPTLSSDSACESRLSDYSDDSKCSPATSPGLHWKTGNIDFPSNGTTPDMLQSGNTCPKRNLHKTLDSHTAFLAYKATQDFSITQKPFKNIESATQVPRERPAILGGRPLPNDVFEGANALVSLKHRTVNPEPSDPHSFAKSNAKRKAETDSVIAPKKTKFDISSILGLN